MITNWLLNVMLYHLRNVTNCSIGGTSKNERNLRSHLLLYRNCCANRCIPKTKGKSFPRTSAYTMNWRIKIMCLQSGSTNLHTMFKTELLWILFWDTVSDSYLELRCSYATLETDVFNDLKLFHHKWTET